MNESNIMFLFILFIVFFLIPVVISRRTGKSYMDVLLGWTKKKKLPDSSAKASDTSDANQKSGTAGSSSAAIPNSTQKDLIELVSRLLTISRRHNMNIVFPGTVIYGDKVATLVALIVTGHGIVGFNSFGYGGTVTYDGKKTWVHNNGVSDTTIPDPTQKNREQYLLVREALDAHGMSDIQLDIIGVFTNRKIQLVGTEDSNCYTIESLCDYLLSDKFDPCGNPDGKRIADDLSKMVKRA